ncbi:MAG: DUF111 family protein [Acidobacteriota bacterium]|nr:DUF111 family protein [Acidobacteriota bacterium]
MNRHLHIDPVGGVAGDMWLGLLVDLGLELEEIEALVRRLGLEGVELRRESVRRGAIAATKVHVVVGGWEEPPGEQAGAPAPHGHHRHLGEMLAMVERAELGERAACRARRTRRLACRPRLTSLSSWWKRSTSTRRAPTTPWWTSWAPAWGSTPWRSPR